MRDVASLTAKAAAAGPAVGIYATRLLDTPLPWTRMRRSPRSARRCARPWLGWIFAVLGPAAATWNLTSWVIGAGAIVLVAVLNVNRRRPSWNPAAARVRPALI